MPLRLYNTLTNTVEPFRPLDTDAARREGRAPRVSFYSCGPTVYDFAHIGNFRSFLAADTLRRWLESPLCERAEGGGGGYEVRQVMNITDVGHMVDDSAADGGGEDKMEAARQRLLEQKKSGKLPPDAAKEFDPSDPYAIAEFYARAFIEDARTLGLRIIEDAARDPALMPRPTRYIRPMLEMILTLLERGHAYVAADGVAYFDTQSFPDYGRLSGNTLDKIRTGAGGRVSEATQAIKKHPADFMLWKPDPTHLMRWDPSKELGRPVALKEGYPGWHIECSAMAAGLLGQEIDLHSGGEDNIFPHHECELAQSRCAHGTPTFARHWFHPRFLQVEGEKMSKSKGNFYTVPDLVKKGFDPGAIRMELVKTHYRSNANLTEQGLVDSQRRVSRWREWARYTHDESLSHLQSPNLIKSLSEQIEAQLALFAEAMNNDLNVAGALAVFDLSLKSFPSFVTSIQPPRPTGDEVTARWEELTALERSVDLPTSPADPETALDWIESGKKNGNPAVAYRGLLHLFDSVLGVIFRPPLAKSAPTEESARIDALVAARTAARSSKNWPEADRIRKELDALGVVVTDGPSGPTWAKKVGL